MTGSFKCCIHFSPKLIYISPCCYTFSDYLTSFFPLNFHGVGKMSYKGSRFSTFTMQSIMTKVVLFQNISWVFWRRRYKFFKPIIQRFVLSEELESNIRNIYFDYSLIVLSWYVRSQMCDLGSRNKRMVH